MNDSRESKREDIAGKAKKISRKDFLKNSFSGLLQLGYELFSETFEAVEMAFPEIIRPPGAVREELFLELCQRCGACVQSCGFFVIKRILDPDSFDSGTPQLILREGFCRMCADYPCTRACESGALRLPEANEFPILGKARLFPSLCLRKKAQTCEACKIICSRRFAAVSILEPDGLPFIDLDRCRGCGACESACPVEPQKAIRISPKT